MSELDLEKGFNESELEDIMSEIESLEKDFGDVDEVESVAEEVEALDEVPVEDPVSEEPVMQEEASTPSQEEISEIESRLESEFDSVEEVSSSEELIVDPDSVEKSSIQAEIEEEVEAIFDEAAAENVTPETKLEQPIAEEVPMEPVLEDSYEPQAEVVEMNSIEKQATSVKSAETKMEFSVAGDMKLKLNFWVNGQSISLHVDEEEGFCIEMEGGAKFSLPVGKKAA